MLAMSADLLSTCAAILRWRMRSPRTRLWARGWHRPGRDGHGRLQESVLWGLRRRTWLFGVSLFLTLVPLSFDFTHGHIVSLMVRDAWRAAFDWSLAAVLWFLYFARLRWRTATLVGAIFFTLLPISFVLHSVLAGGRVLEFAIVWIWAALIWVGYFRQRVG